MLDLELLRSFVSVVDAGGFTRAGERVHRTQSTVSQQIKRLEEDVGQPLLIRSGKDVTPTEAGERLLSYARRLLSLAEGGPRRALASRQRGRDPDRHHRGLRRLPADATARDLPAQPSELCGSTCAPARACTLYRDLERGDLDLALIKRAASEKGGIAVWPERVHWVTSKSHPRDTTRRLGAADRLRLGLSLPRLCHPCAGARRPQLAHGLHLLQPRRHPGRGRRGPGLEHSVGDVDPGRASRADREGRLCADRGAPKSRSSPRPKPAPRRCGWRTGSPSIARV